ncbi:hypothetical protein ACFWTE_28270 [Nocardiopsis sp. NPDC058631]|uniref:hypothetical protein n=1 Tax=Nocardiopsis sp. NPDC058631 TaxID=3346566 RepID=UPI00364D88D1
MTRPVPASKYDQLFAAFPELHEYGRPALLLHPHLGEPGPEDSSVGGPLLWPTDEPWPTCDLLHHSHDLGDGAAEVRFDEPVALQPVLQLFAHDLPDGHGFPGGATLLQVLWCPNDHPAPPHADGHSFTPWLTLRWRHDTTHLRALDDQPHPHTSAGGYALPPCALAVEEITDYPCDDSLPEDLARRVMEWEEDVPQSGHVIPKPSYFDASSRSGMKLGGFQRWGLTDPFPVECACGAAMEYLLQISSLEPGGLERLVIGRGYSFGVHYCPASLDHPHHTVMQ